MHFSKVIIGTILLGLAGCGSPAGNGYFDSGAGLSLYTPGTPKATDDLRNYYKELCKQADPLREPDKEGESTCEPNKNVLVRTGFNDIDLRCDGYLAWIDRQRTDARTFRSGTIAVNTLATGLGTVSERSIRNIAQILGFANSIYDAYNNSILAGIESSTIKKLVYARRAAFRKEFSGLEYPTYAEATYALRRYLQICTPQTIVLTANEFAIAAANGTRIDLNKAAQEQAAFIKPVTPGTKANIQPKRPQLGPCPNCDKVFAIGGFQTKDIAALQNRLCIGKSDDKNKVDSDPGEITLSKLAEWDAVYGIKGTDKKISSQNEWFRLNNTGCTDADVDQGYRNVFEKKLLKDQTVVSGVIDTINAKLELAGNDQIDNTKPLNHPAVRAGIALARSRLDVADPNISDQQEFSKALQNALLK